VQNSNTSQNIVASQQAHEGSEEDEGETVQQKPSLLAMALLRRYWNMAGRQW
jgi:hypothetical protein